LLPLAFRLCFLQHILPAVLFSHRGGISGTKCH
jgi:hypothetical protein